MQQITENSLNVCANGITSEEISEIRNCIRRIARRRELEGKKELNWRLELNSRKYVPPQETGHKRENLFNGNNTFEKMSKFGLKITKFNSIFFHFAFFFRSI